MGDFDNVNLIDLSEDDSCSPPEPSYSPIEEEGAEPSPAPAPDMIQKIRKVIGVIIGVASLIIARISSLTSFISYIFSYFLYYQKEQMFENAAVNLTIYAHDALIATIKFSLIGAMLAIIGVAMGLNPEKRNKPALITSGIGFVLSIVPVIFVFA